jgi:hypothetical protein
MRGGSRASWPRRYRVQAEAAVALFAYGAAVSYDLYMLSPQPGEDPMETVERLEEREEAAAPDPVMAERNRRIADALIATNSNYTESEIKFDVIAEQNGISVEEARAKHRYIELMEEGGLQITLSDDHAWINFPYWDSLDPKHLADEIAKTSKVIGQPTGWKLYDPQLEKFTDPARDASEFAEAFGVGVGHVRRIAAEHSSADSASDERPSF